MQIFSKKNTFYVLSHYRLSDYFCKKKYMLLPNSLLIDYSLRRMVFSQR